MSCASGDVIQLLSRSFNGLLSIRAGIALEELAPASTVPASVEVVAASVTHVLAMEVVESPVSPGRVRAMISVARIVAVIDVAVKLSAAMEPGTRPDKCSAIEPLGPVIAIGRAVVRSVIVIAIGAGGLRSDVDGNLGVDRG